mmetsp:Transcript_23626/g.43881  ORF Transcript_23626/g.43881 Transcript_23626/m.43881 type:complete len:459 (+) Transcript_23626:119-1495(+)
MNFAAPEAMEVQQVDGMGRAWVARAAIGAGQVVLQDSAFVAATCDDDECVACGESHSVESEESDAGSATGSETGGSAICEAFNRPPWVALGREMLFQAEDGLADIEGIDDLDKARVLLKCLAMERTVLDEAFKDLSGEHMTKCEATATQVNETPFASELRALANLSDDQEGFKALVARIVAVMNTNCHTLEDIEGVGIFLKGCIFAHDCNPNCNYSSTGTNLVALTTRDVKAGDILSLDYLNSWAIPTGERMEKLRDSYGFECTCAKCAGLIADRVRAFNCPRKADDESDHVVCAFGGPETNVFKCLACDYIASEEEAGAFRAAEEAYRNGTIQEETLQSLRSEHHLLLEGVQEAKEDTVPGSEEHLNLWKFSVKLTDLLLPPAHHERVIVFDQLGQLLFQANDHDGSRKAFRKALEESRKCNGDASVSNLTKSLEMIVENPPKTIQELIASYSHSTA